MQIINLIGHIGRDAETKHIGERDYISFSVACTEKRNNEEATTWYSILYPYQEAIVPYLKKGQQVFIMGRLSAKIYQSNNSFGIDLSVFAQTLQLCGGKREEGSVSGGSTAAPTTPSSIPTASQPSTPFPPRVDENGIPKQDDDPLPF